MLIHSIISNYLKKTIRSPFGKWILGGNVFVIICLWIPVFLYAFYTGFSVVQYLNIDHSIDLLAGVNTGILHVFIGWGLVDGLFLQRKVSASLFPYLVTPTPRRTLALFYQIITLFGKSNLFVLAFFAGFWTKNLYLQDVSFAWTWLLVLCLLYICTQLAANILRSWRGGGYLPVLGTLFFVSVLVVLELGFNVRILSKASATLFDAATEGAFWSPVLLSGLAIFLFYGSTKKISRSLYIDHSVVPRFLLSTRRVFPKKREPRNLSAELLSCEWKLLFRNQSIRPGLFTLIVLIPFIAFLDVGLIGMGENTPLVPGMLSTFLIFFPTSIYFLYAFDYRSSFYDCVQSRPITETKILYTIISMSHRFTLFTLFIFIFTIILINIIVNEITSLAWIVILGNMLFGMGIVNISTLFLSTLYPVSRNLNAKLFQPVVITSTPNINFIYILAFPMLYFGIQIWFLDFVSSIWIGLTSIILGFMGLCLQSRLLKLFASNLHKRRYVIMERFRLG